MGGGRDFYFFSLGGDRATWLDEGFGNNEYDHVESVDLRGVWLRRSELELIREPTGGGKTLGDIDADGSVAAYGALSWRDCYSDGSANGQPISGCRSTVLGGRVSFINQRQALEDVPPPAAIAVSGSRLAIAPPLLETCACNDGPAWSPDGAAIAYSTRNLDVDWEVVVAQPDGRPSRVTDNWTMDFAPDWSPDGSRLVYQSSDHPARPGRIVVSNRDGTDRRTIAEGHDPAWSPSGDQIAYNSASAGVWLVNADGTGNRHLPGTGGRTTAGARGTGRPAWSPDGTELAYSYGEGLVVQRADGTGEQRVIATGGRRPPHGDQEFVVSPTWSPRGDEIAYVRETYDLVELRVVRTDGTGDRLLLGANASLSAPDWSPDGSQIAFFRDGELYTISPTGGAVTRVTNTRLRRYRAPVEIRTVNGALVSRFLPTKNPATPAERRSRISSVSFEILLSDSVAAAMSVRGQWRERVARRGVLVEYFKPETGRRIGTASLPSGVRAWPSLAGRTLVFAVGRRIWAQDVFTHKRRLVATADSRPLGLSIEGRRIAWAENLRTQSRIRAVFLR